MAALRSLAPLLAATTLLAGCFDFARLSAGSDGGACSGLGCPCVDDTACIAAAVESICVAGTCQSGCDDQVACTTGRTCCSSLCIESDSCAGDLASFDAAPEAAAVDAARDAAPVDGPRDAGKDAVATDGATDGSAPCSGAGCACSQTTACSASGTLCCSAASGLCRTGGSACTGSCTVGNCCSNADCGTGQVCALDHVCRPRCTNGACSGNARCCGGTCYPGACTTTLAGSGLGGPPDSVAGSALFSGVGGIVADPAGPVYYTDLHAGLRVVNLGKTALGPSAIPAGSVGRLTGGFGCKAGPSLSAELETPYGITRDAQGNLYLADGGCAVIWKVSSDLTTVSVLAGQRGTHTTVDGVGAAAGFSDPLGITYGSDGNLYVSDIVANKIRRVALDGTVTTVAGSGAIGDGDGAALTATFNQPGAITADYGGTLYVGEWTGARVRALTGAGTAGAQVKTLVMSSNIPFGTAAVIGTTLYLNEWDSGVWALAPNGASWTQTQLDAASNGTWSLAADAAATGLWVGGWVEGNGSRSNLLVHTDLTGKLLASYGTASKTGVSDGSAAVATFDTAACGGGVVVDLSGNAIVADHCAQRVRRVALADGSVSSIGSGTLGELAGTAASALLCNPSTPIQSGTSTYVTDFGCGFRIAQIDATGNVSLVGALCIGGVTNCFYPSVLGHGTVDGQGNLYIPVQQQLQGGAAPSSSLILKVPSLGAGTPTIVAGTQLQAAATAAQCADGAVGNAVLGTVYDLALDSAGTLWMADAVCGVRKLAGGLVTTVAPSLPSLGLAVGPGPSGADTLYVSGSIGIYVVDRASGKSMLWAGGTGGLDSHFLDGPNQLARFWQPGSIGVDSNGVLYVLDLLNARVRLVYP